MLLIGSEGQVPSLPIALMQTHALSYPICAYLSVVPIN